jgi:hypothetical protein
MLDQRRRRDRIELDPRNDRRTIAHNWLSKDFVDPAPERVEDAAQFTEPQPVLT